MFSSKHDGLICPVCRHGELTQIVLMEAVSCSFCRHIFSSDETQSILTLEDSVQPDRWQWIGKKWQQLSQDHATQRVWLWSLAFFLMVLPTAIVWVSSQLFPPAEDTIWAIFPALWTGLTLFAHGSLALWLLCEHFQWAYYVRLKILLSQSFSQA